MLGHTGGRLNWIVKYTWFWRYLACSWYMKMACRSGSDEGVSSDLETTVNGRSYTAGLTGRAGMKIFTYSCESLGG